MCLPPDCGGLEPSIRVGKCRRAVVPTECRSEVGDEIMPAGASAFVIPADSLWE
jgi:hypothetical protein